MAKVNESNSSTLKRRDIVFYRLLVLFAYAILSIVGVNLLKQNYNVKDLFMVLNSVYFKIGMLVLFIAAIAVVVMRIGKDRVIRLYVIAGLLAPLFFVVGIYTNVTNASLKALCVVIASIVVGFVYIVFSKKFFFYTLFVTLDYFALYYLYRGIDPNRIVDVIIQIVSYPIAFIIPVVGIVLSVFSLLGKELKIGKLELVDKNSNKLTTIMCLVLSVVLLVAAILSFIVPILYTVLWYVLLIVIVVVGIVCIIKLL